MLWEVLMEGLLTQLLLTYFDTSIDTFSLTHRLLSCRFTLHTLLLAWYLYMSLEIKCFFFYIAPVDLLSAAMVFMLTSMVP